MGQVDVKYRGEYYSPAHGLEKTGVGPGGDRLTTPPVDASEPAITASDASGHYARAPASAPLPRREAPRPR